MECNGQTRRKDWIRQLNDAGNDDEFDRSPSAVLKRMVSGGGNLPWNLALAGLVGFSLLLTRVTLGADRGLTNAHHVFGCLVLTVVAIAAAEVQTGALAECHSRHWSGARAARV